MNRDLFSGDRKFVVKGQNLNNHFNSNNLKQTIDFANDFFAKNLEGDSRKELSQQQ